MGCVFLASLNRTSSWVLLLLVALAAVLVLSSPPAPEGFEPSSSSSPPSDLSFQSPTRQNPFGNVLLTDIDDRPKRPGAPPSFDRDVNREIKKQVKRAIQRLNPTIHNTSDQLFGDVFEEYRLDQSLRAFYSMPNTKVVNDASAFAKFLYGNMPSSKETNLAGNLQRSVNTEHSIRVF